MPLTKDPVRKLARVVTISQILEHKNADRLEIALIDGWQCVILKDEMKAGDKAFYFEIDAAVPVEKPIFSFLNSRITSLRTDENTGKVYSIIKTIKLRGVVSQGLLIPIPPEYADAVDDPNLQETLGVLKWVRNHTDVIEKVKRAERWHEKVARWIRGKDEPSVYQPWIADVPKTDQERIQNLPFMHRTAVEEGETFEKTQKLNGQSVTVYSDGKDVYVMNRNNTLATEDFIYTFAYSLRLYISRWWLRIFDFFKSGYWGAPPWKNRQSVLTDKVVAWFNKCSVGNSVHGYSLINEKRIAVQGELVGSGINGDAEHQGVRTFYVFNIYVEGEDGSLEELAPEVARDTARRLGLHYVPVLDDNALLDPDMNNIIKDAEGPSLLNKKVKREGLVYKSNKRRFSFKVISNSYLLKEAEEEENTV